MDAITKVLERKAVLAAVCLVAGIAIGILFAWVIVPVNVVDASIEQLRTDLRTDYMRMVIDSYSQSGDSDLAVERYNQLGETRREVLSDVSETYGAANPAAYQEFMALLDLSAEPETDAEAAPAVEDEGEEEAGGLTRLLLPVCGGTVLLGAALAGAIMYKRRMDAQKDSQLEPLAFSPETIPPEEERGGFFEQVPQATAAKEPLATFRTTFSLGDDLYDDSFSIESPSSGDFMGECGVGIGDIIGVGEPKKVSAFEVWLFDKNDIQTVTKVMMSRYAFQDEATRNRMAAKGDPTELVNGGVIHLETASLKIEARVVDMNYGQGPLPPESYLDRLTVELKAWAKGDV